MNETIIAATISALGSIISQLAPLFWKKLSSKKSIKIISIFLSLTIIPGTIGFLVYYSLSNPVEKRILRKLGQDTKNDNLILSKWGFGIKLPNEGWYYNITGHHLNGGTFHIYKVLNYEKNLKQVVRFHISCEGKDVRTHTVEQYFDHYEKMLISVMKDLGAGENADKLIHKEKIVLGDGNYDCIVYKYNDPINGDRYLQHHIIVDSRYLIIFLFKSVSIGHFERNDPGKFETEVTQIIRSIKFDTSRINEMIKIVDSKRQ